MFEIHLAYICTKPVKICLQKREICISKDLLALKSLSAYQAHKMATQPN